MYGRVPKALALPAARHGRKSRRTLFAIWAAALYLVTTSELERSVTASSPAFTSASLSDDILVGVKSFRC